MLRRTFPCLLFLAALFVPASLFAQPPERGGPPGRLQDGMRGGPPEERIMQLFEQADANGDGSVTKAELSAAMESHAGGRRPERGGERENFARGGRNGRRTAREGAPPRPEGEAGPSPRDREHHGPRPEPGQVLPEPIAEALDLSEEQRKQLADLQGQVDEQLANILTLEQKEQLENMEPPHGPPGRVGGGPSERRGDRPQRLERPQRPE